MMTKAKLKQYLTRSGYLKRGTIIKVNHSNGIKPDYFIIAGITYKNSHFPRYKVTLLDSTPSYAWIFGETRYLHNILLRGKLITILENGLQKAKNVIKSL
jgi:hypothetical protein